MNDALVRRERLAELRDAMRNAPIQSALVSAVEDKLLQTYGEDTVMVRFRSSSNAEDALSFSGAGLYDSTSACLADERDGDDVGPSRCDADKDAKRTVTRAIGKVWASLWKMEAYEERTWYGMDHTMAQMGILVNTRTKNEQANIVAFSGNPTADDDRTLVNAQVGELDVVSAEPGVFPEKNLLEVENQVVEAIIRVNHSSEKPHGWVLSDEQLEELGARFSEIEANYPIDESIPPNTTLLLDTEWKVTSEGQLIIKQIRPFLREGTHE